MKMSLKYVSLITTFLFCSNSFAGQAFLPAIFIDDSSSWWQVAVNNVSTVDLTATVEVYTPSGDLVQTSTKTVSAGGSNYINITKSLIGNVTMQGGFAKITTSTVDEDDSLLPAQVVAGVRVFDVVDGNTLNSFISINGGKPF